MKYSVTQCPRTQASILCGWIGRILDDLLEIGSSHPWMEQYLQGWLQPQLTETLSSLLRQNTDKVKITNTPQRKKNAFMKSLQFSSGLVVRFEVNFFCLRVSWYKFLRPVWILCVGSLCQDGSSPEVTWEPLL